ncbi:salt tolerance down-regulator-domain-containing protein [Cantharellus anzutake]|uniref:salt tolerance down-regulator-domain-containing protein n=1 Tax=Cantharellus anzutake TaxID=1750568 RepID=UPI0019071564|nr:salt tolerance down-regulator-domain-containing protein [Cantharellus anzutake]KAF8335950.1 salt tolerance down-regulator-domain-containing protein [Cantharellus anzutake]
MSVNPKSSVKQNAPARTAVAPPPPPVPVETNTSAKKKKRKKDKARGDASADEDDDDEPPPLEPNPPRATGLSPELAAAHLSTNSPSESPVSATREASQPKTNEPYNPLLEAAAQIPANELSKAQTMYAIAQQMIRTGGKGASKGLPGSYPLENAPFDSAVLSDPAIRRSLEAAFNTANSNGDQVYDNGEFYTEDEGDEDPRYQVEVEVHRDGIETSPAEPQQKLPPQQLVPEQKPVGKKNKKKKKNANTPPQPSTPEPVKARVNPIPGSRAAGKLPMSYTTSNPPSQNPPLAPPSKNSRLASRAPTANNYTTARGRQVPVMTNVSGRGKRSIGSNKQNSNNIWPTNSPEERERIKEFWLKLGERERRDLVKVEKEAVLKKMKEQQRHGCSCAVCGRKRNAIEQELEVLYEAYYEDLEHYANLQQQAASRGLPPPGPGPFPGSVALDKNGQVISAPTPQPKQLSNTRRGQQPNGVRKGQRRTLDEDEYDEDEDDYDDEDYDDEDEMDDEDDIDYEDYNGKGRRKTESKMFSFNSQFTAAGPGNILTVADDLLKNDGQKFLEMMEQLAERRMQREGEAVASIEDDSEDEDEDEDDGDEDEEEEDDSEEDRIMTEEQKMQEGKRMFSVFAARMFEQRVLQAYRERLAWEQKQQILEELRQAAEKRAKQEAEAEKKREKKRWIV